MRRKRISDTTVLEIRSLRTTTSAVSLGKLFDLPTKTIVGFCVGVPCRQQISVFPSLLTEAQVLEIRANRGIMSFPEMAKNYGVSVSAVQFAAMGRTWRRLPLSPNSSLPPGRPRRRA